MQRNVDLRIDAVKIVEHAHVEIEIIERAIFVLRLHEIDADDAGIFLG